MDQRSILSHYTQVLRYSDCLVYNCHFLYHTTSTPTSIASKACTVRCNWAFTSRSFSCNNRLRTHASNDVSSLWSPGRHSIAFSFGNIITTFRRILGTWSSAKYEALELSTDLFLTLWICMHYGRHSDMTLACVMYV